MSTVDEEAKALSDWLVEELKKRGLSAMVVVAFQRRDAPNAGVAYACANDLDPVAATDTIIDGLHLFMKDKGK